MAISLGVRRLMVYGDSDLVVNQVMKEWDVGSPAMTGYCNAVRKLERKFEAKKAIKSQAIAYFLAEWIEQQLPTQVHSEH